MIWLIVIIIGIIGYVLFSIYKHDDSLFSKQTGYTYFDIFLDPKAKAAKKLYDQLVRSSEVDKILLDVKMQDGIVERKADAVFIHSSGIYIVNILHKDGWIAGREFDAEWTNLLHKNQVQQFENPVNNNKLLGIALRQTLPEVNEDLFGTVILFTTSCAFQKIEIQSPEVEVLKTNELKQWRESLAGELLTAAQISSIYEALKPYAKEKKYTQVKQQLGTSEKSI